MREIAGLLITGRAKPYAPPFMMLGLNLENTTSNDFRITATARYLTYGILTRIGAPNRWNARLESGARIELYQPIGVHAPLRGGLRVASTGPNGAFPTTRIVGAIRRDHVALQLDAGANLGRRSDLRVGAYFGPSTPMSTWATRGCQSSNGKETGADARWRYDDQDSPVVPSRGLAAVSAAAHLRRSRQRPGWPGDSARSSGHAVRGGANRFWRLGERNRLFVGGALARRSMATAADRPVLARRSAQAGGLRPGELRGQNYYSATAGYLRQVARLPDFMGGPVFAGGWLDQATRSTTGEAAWRANPGFGVVMDTLLGPVMVAGSAGFDGRWRTYFGVGRIFR